MSNDTSCGSPNCLLDGLKEAIDKQGMALKEQHQESREFMRELMMTHVGHLSMELEKTSRALTDHASKLYPMIRDVGERLTALENQAIKEPTVDAKIAKALKDDNNLQWVSGYRKFARGIMAAATIAILLEIGVVITRLYDSHNMSQPQTIEKIRP